MPFVQLGILLLRTQKSRGYTKSMLGLLSA